MATTQYAVKPRGIVALAIQYHAGETASLGPQLNRAKHRGIAHTISACRGVCNNYLGPVRIRFDPPPLEPRLSTFIFTNIKG